MRFYGLDSGPPGCITCLPAGLHVHARIPALVFVPGLGMTRPAATPDPENSRVQPNEPLARGGLGDRPLDEVLSIGVGASVKLPIFEDGG